MGVLTFLPGQTIIRPGVAIALQNVTPPPTPQLGTVAAIFAADWGPLGVATSLSAYGQVASTFGSTGTIDLAQHAFTGGALSVLAYRAGSGGSFATVSLLNGAAGVVLTLTAKYRGNRPNAASPAGGFNAIVRVNLTDATKKDIVVSEGTVVLQVFTYTASVSEGAAAVAAVNAAASAWVTATIGAAPATVVTIGGPFAFAGGVSPAALAGSDYSTAMTAIETLQWNVLVTDIVDATYALQALVYAFIDRVRQVDGAYNMCVIGQPSSVALASRQGFSAGTNDAWAVFVGNGGINAAGIVYDGYPAAGRTAGMIASLPVTGSLTHKVIPDWVSVSGPLATPDVNNCIANGMVVFTLNALNQVQVEYGITTLITPPANMDNGWKKIRRVRTRDYFIASLDQAWTPMLGVTTNDINGQTALINAAQLVINKLISLGAFRAPSSCAIDSANPASGDSAWFIINFLDNDSAEHVYATVQTQF